MKTEQVEKQAVNYTTLEFPKLLSLAISGDKAAAAEIIARQEAATAEIESLKIKANKARTPRAEKTPKELAAEKTYFRTALLVKQFGLESVNLQVLTTASAYFDQGLAQGNLRQALNRIQQVLKAQAVTESVFPDWILTAAEEIPVLDENKKLEEESDKVEQIRAIVQKYKDNEQLPAPPEVIVIPETPEASKKAGGKAGGKK
jgi:hypothetical protein